jgi:putative FmdB family regulatory protein
MPRYDYRCPACGDVVERSHGFDVTEVRSYCDKTEQEVVLERLFTMPTVHFKGYGFYVTDNRDAGERYSFDHFDGSGTNSERKAMERRIKHPESTIPRG